jgi:hypothetical protein
MYIEQVQEWPGHLNISTPQQPQYLSRLSCCASVHGLEPLFDGTSRASFLCFGEAKTCMFAAKMSGGAQNISGPCLGTQYVSIVCPPPMNDVPT